MNYCGQCGATVGEDQQFCHRCGARLAVPIGSEVEGDAHQPGGDAVSMSSPTDETQPITRVDATLPPFVATTATPPPLPKKRMGRGPKLALGGLFTLLIIALLASTSHGVSSTPTNNSTGPIATDPIGSNASVAATVTPQLTHTAIPQPTDVPTPSASSWAQDVTSDTYADVRDHPDIHQGDKVVWQCHINKFLGTDPNDSSVTDLSCGGFDGGFSEAILAVPSSVDTSAMHANDNVTAYGTVAAPFQGTNGFNATIIDPQLTIAYLDDTTLTNQATSVAQQTADALTQPTMDAASTATSIAADAQVATDAAAQQTAAAQSQADADASATASSQSDDATAQAYSIQATATEAVAEASPRPVATPSRADSSISLSYFRLPASVAGPSHFFEGEGGGNPTQPADSYIPSRNKNASGVYQYGVIPKIPSAAGFVHGEYAVTIYRTVDAARQANAHERNTARDDSKAFDPLSIARVAVVADNEWLRGRSATRGGNLYCVASGGVRYKNVRAFVLIQDFKSVTPSGYIPCTTEDRWVTRAMLKTLYPTLVTYVDKHR